MIRYRITGINLPALFSVLFLMISTADASAQNPAVGYTAFQPGEELIYNIHYGMVNAASATLSVSKKYSLFNNKPHYLISAISKTYKTWDWFYPVRDYFYSYVDTSTLFPVYAVRKIHEGDYRTTDNLVFNRKNSTIISNGKAQKVNYNLFDILSAVYFARCIDFNNIPLHREIPIYTFFDNEVFPVGLIYEGKEIITTKLGKFRCLVIRPKLVQGRIFKGQYDMTLYVTDDNNHMPLKVRTAIFVGYIQAELTSYRGLKYPLTSKIN